ncbi:hypothetical protein ACX801_08045 [Arthrobacter bambusae]
MLQRLDLLARHNVPTDPSDARFCAHLWASARGVMDYTRTGNEDYIRLLDEHPDDADAIANKVHSQGIRALLAGDTVAGVVSGAL